MRGEGVTLGAFEGEGRPERAVNRGGQDPDARGGQARPARLTKEGRARLAAVQDAVYAIERHMTAAIPPERVAALLTDLDCMAAALEQ
ncbi:hypothetical protein ACIRYZ_33675 [Kitasatospora sp. NPDC101155]|uniref:hypothetical protein n=1 Tax=Kitasatospora sp. NPDC101155 TaxID=3364097 RepID=UPI0037FDCEE5